MEKNNIANKAVSNYHSVPQRRSPHGRPKIKLRSGDINVEGQSVQDCQQLAGIANALRESTTPEIKVGPISAQAGTVNKLGKVLGLGVLCIGAYYSIKYTYHRYKNKLNNLGTDDSSNKPEFLKPIPKNTEVLTLNQIGHSNCLELIPLLGGFLYAGDIAFNFSISNSGKTLWAVQCGVELARGIKSTIVPNGSQPVKQDVLYYNFEMRKNHFKKRYFGTDPNASYPDNLEFVFCRATIKTVDQLMEDIAGRAERMKSDTTIFIDTIKDVCPTSSAKEADRVIGSLRTISDNAMQKNGVRLTFVLLGQANKKKYWEPIELDDLSGSFNQIGLADSVFAIGKTRYGSSVRMLKMLKGRNDELKDKVILLNIVDTPYLRMEYFEEVEEEDALPIKPKARGGHSSLSQPSPSRSSSNSIMGVPIDVVKQMKAWYKKGVDGHGAKAVVKKFGLPYGLKHPMQVTRILDKYDELAENNTGGDSP